MIDVAIVGGGPTGVVAANLCGQYGLSAVALDREPDVYDLPRAAGMHDDVQRILSNADLLDAVLPGTVEHVGAEFVDRDGTRLIGIEFPGLNTPNGFPPVLAIAQPEIERALRGRLDRFPDVELRVSQELRGFEQHDDHVELHVHDLERDESRTVRARWVIGADGASSFVRKSCGISWNSLGYDHEWLVIDVACTAPVDLPRFATQVCDPARPTTIIPMPPPLHRWEFQLRPGETREEMEDRDRVWELVRPWISREQANLLRAVVYRFHATIAQTFRCGRVFLAGDAAHQTPPFMGQGLCTGVRDAENLVWKMAAVKAGLATDALLDTYTEERHPMAVAMVQHSTNTGKLIDAYAEMTVTGTPPSEELIQYGYGGTKQLPSLSTGLLGEGESRWIGQLVPQCVVGSGSATGTYDEIVGTQWALLAKTDPRGLVSGEQAGAWEELGAAFLTLDDPNASRMLGDSDVAVVRPDRIIFSLGPDARLPEPFAHAST